MSAQPPKVGLHENGYRTGTGPATYAGMIAGAMGNDFPIRRLAESGADVDVIHLVDAKRIPLSFLDSVAAPVIADFHDHYWVDGPTYPAFDRPLRRWRSLRLRAHHLAVIRHSRLLIVHSQAVRQKLEPLVKQTAQTAGILPPPITLVPLAAPLPDSPPAASRDPNLILMVGRDLVRKGFAVLVAALRQVIRSNPDAHAVVIGQEFPHARLWARFIARGLPVVFTGGVSRAELEGWYARASLLALPSWEEAFGLAVLEAMARGVPVAASSAGGIPEAAGEAALLHAPGDHQTLAAHIAELLGDRTGRAQLIEAGRARAELFTMEKMKQALEQAYREARG